MSPDPNPRQANHQRSSGLPSQRLPVTLGLFGRREPLRRMGLCWRWFPGRRGPSRETCGAGDRLKYDHFTHISTQREHFLAHCIPTSATSVSASVTLFSALFAAVLTVEGVIFMHNRVKVMGTEGTSWKSLFARLLHTHRNTGNESFTN